MKKMIVWSLCFVMALSAFMPAWSAVLPSGAKEMYEGGRGRPPPPPPRGGRPHGGGGRPSHGGRRPPPPPRHHDRYYRDHRNGGSGWVGFGVGAAIGTAIGAVVANSAPAPEPSMVYDPGCNCYYYR